MSERDLADVISDVVSQDQVKKSNCFIPYFYLGKVYFYQDEQIVRSVEDNKLIFLNPELNKDKMRERYICMRVAIEKKSVEVYGTCSAEILLKQKWREEVK